jgi:hypothetical protein
MAQPNESGIGLMNPIARIGDNVAILYEKWRYYKVTYQEGVPPFQVLDLGALAAGASTPAPVIAPNLELNPDEFGQFRWYPIDHAEMRLYSPQASGRYYLKNLLVPVDKNIVHRDPDLHFTEFFTWQDKRPAFAATAGSIALTQCRVMAMGFRFHGEVITDTELIVAIQRNMVPCVKIVAQGLG